MSKQGKNESCKCGSGLKYKNCCQLKDDLEKRKGALIEGKNLIYSVSTKELTEKLGISPDAFLKIYTSNDWTFVVLSNALIETSVSLYLSMCFGDEFIEIFQKLPMDHSYGKLAFLKKTNFTKQLIPFIESIGKLRNRLTHQIKNIDFKFSFDSKSDFSSEVNRIFTELTKIWNVDKELLKKDIKGEILFTILMIISHIDSKVDWQKLFDNDDLILDMRKR